MKWRMRKKLRMLAMNVRQKMGIADSEAERDVRNGKQNDTGEAE
jgi:hypothetical protein